jgi:hydroxyethylthiazole kinase-like uncharacterized protein yjeF
MNYLAQPPDRSATINIREHRTAMIELLTPAEMARADALAGNADTLMQAAGRAVARAVMRHIRPCPVLVLAGPGHNGGDGRVAAARLTEAGWPVRVSGLDANVDADANAAMADVARAGLVIDALFGAGLNRPLPAQAATLLRAARRIVAVDVPSGLDGATGMPHGDVTPAALTVTFFRAKPGHYLLPGRALCGVLEVADIGMPAGVLESVHCQTYLNGPALWRLPVRAAAGHKYSSGDVTVLGGAMPGAARLSCAAARRAGAGMVTLAATGGAALPEMGLIVSAAPLATLLQDRRRQVFVCGPGLGADAGDKLALLLAAGRTVVADADALTACTGAPARLRGAAVITPHTGEFTRVFGAPGPDRLAAVRAAALATGAVTLLKGADTIIAAPDGRAAINANAPPWLATGGTGDVLTGIIAAYLAQGMAPFEATCAAVYVHGAAGALAGSGMLAEDLPGLLPAVMRGLV